VLSLYLLLSGGLGDVIIIIIIIIIIKVVVNKIEYPNYWDIDNLHINNFLRGDKSEVKVRLWMITYSGENLSNWVS